MERTSKTKKYYTPIEVDNYLKKMLSASEVALCEQKDRIVELKKQIDKLQTEMETQKEKNKILSKAMNDTSRLVKEQNKDMNLKTQISIDKLRAFGFRWKNYFNQLFENVSELSGNKSNILFEQEMIELIDEIQELAIISSNAKDKKIPHKKSDLNISKDEWLLSNSCSSEFDYSLSEEGEEKYSNMLKVLKKQMIYMSELQGPSDNGFDLDEAMNPKDSLGKIIGDLI